MAVTLDFPRITLITRNYILNRFANSNYQSYYNSIINRYLSNSNGMQYRSGKAKVEGRFPILAVEIKEMRNEWVALNYFKEYTVELYIDIYLKALGANTIGVPTNFENDPTSILETFLAEMSELTQQILNDPGNVRFELNLDQFGNPAKPDQVFFCNNSFSDSLDMEFLYESPIRASRLTWRGTIQQVGQQKKFLDINTE